mmetsp:Transcript_13880/g.32939  ORF Transcript_13880/g.32939 Transcript_13880/m.32939 type:complete len:329 (+) Transcript_13880:4219-5205(+)
MGPRHEDLRGDLPRSGAQEEQAAAGAGEVGVQAEAAQGGQRGAEEGAGDGQGLERSIQLLQQREGDAGAHRRGAQGEVGARRQVGGRPSGREGEVDGLPGEVRHPAGVPLRGLPGLRGLHELRGALRGLLPQRAGHRGVDGQREGEGSAVHHQLHLCQLPGKGHGGERVEFAEAASRRLQHGEWRVSDQEQALPADDRPPEPGQCLGPEDGGDAAAEGLRPELQGHHEVTGARHRVRKPCAPGERGRGAGSIAGADLGQEHHRQRRGQPFSQGRRQRAGLQRRLHVLHHHQAFQPPLYPRGVHQDHHCELHRGAGRSHQPAAGRHREV